MVSKNMMKNTYLQCQKSLGSYCKLVVRYKRRYPLINHYKLILLKLAWIVKRTNQVKFRGIAYSHKSYM